MLRAVIRWTLVALLFASYWSFIAFCSMLFSLYVWHLLHNTVHMTGHISDNDDDDDDICAWCTVAMRCCILFSEAQRRHGTDRTTEPAWWFAWWWHHVMCVYTEATVIELLSGLRTKRMGAWVQCRVCVVFKYGGPRLRFLSPQQIKASITSLSRRCDKHTREMIPMLLGRAVITVQTVFTVYKHGSFLWHVSPGCQSVLSN